jgi:hypothetical protein
VPTITLTPIAISAPNRTITITTSIDAVTHVLPNMPLDNPQECLERARVYLRAYYEGLQAQPPTPPVHPQLTAALNQPIQITF